MQKPTNQRIIEAMVENWNHELEELNAENLREAIGLEPFTLFFSKPDLLEMCEEAIEKTR